MNTKFRPDGVSVDNPVASTPLSNVHLRWPGRTNCIKKKPEVSATGVAADRTVVNPRPQIVSVVPPRRSRGNTYPEVFHYAEPILPDAQVKPAVYCASDGQGQASVRFCDALSVSGVA